MTCSSQLLTARTYISRSSCVLRLALRQPSRELRTIANIQRRYLSTQLDKSARIPPADLRLEVVKRDIHCLLKNQTENDTDSKSEHEDNNSTSDVEDQETDKDNVEKPSDPSSDSSPVHSSSGNNVLSGNTPPDDGDKPPSSGRRKSVSKRVSDKEKPSEVKDDNKSAKKNTSDENETARVAKGPIQGSKGERTGNSPAASFRVGYASPEDKNRVLSIVVNDRPLIPGYHRAIRISDPEVIYSVRRLFFDNLDDQCVAVFFRRPGSTVKDEVLRNVDDVYSVGCYCRIGGVYSRADNGQEGCTLTVLPLSRIKIGELVGPQANEIETETRDQAQDKKDVTSFDTAASSEENDLYTVNAPWMVSVRVLHDEPFDVRDQEIQALCSQILEVMKELSTMSQIFREQIVSFAVVSLKPSTEAFQEPASLADFAAAMSGGTTEIQEILECLDIKERLTKAATLLNRELMQITLQDKFKKSVEVKLQNRYKKVYLEEKISEIKKELGVDKQEKSSNVFRERVKKLILPDHVKKVFEEEIARLEANEASSTDHNMTRHYLDWLTQMPWGIYSEDKYSIKEAKEVLEKGHYGLKDVKDRILEFIATARLRGSVDGKIICFCGPPGVGKTSIGKSIAEALGRKFSRISVGGINDVSEIKGHRRTYVGAVPGRVIQALKQCQTQNPLILIDEIDKIGKLNVHGDPSAALLELLDPEQNSSFVDTFLDLPMDVSKVLFVCTANYIENIPPPLKDRMEVIDISGYVSSERVAIAEQYLVPNIKKSSGLEDIDVTLTKESIERLVRVYSRENGVRGLKKMIEKVFRKVAMQLVEKYDDGSPVYKKVGEQQQKPESSSSGGSGPLLARTSPVDLVQNINEFKEEENPDSSKLEFVKLNIPSDVSIKVDTKDLSGYLGPPIHLEERMYDETPVGVVMGLAYTEMGGLPLYVESVLQQPIGLSTAPNFTRTGQLGDVMSESCSIAYSFCRMLMSKMFPKNRFFEKAVIHLHCPEGAIKKDGPSAGITMTTSLLSLALNHPLDPTICMTGEITLTGKVLRIGGLKEKTMAAKMAGAKTLFYPYDNIADWENLPGFIREGIEAIPVKWYSEVFDRSFADLDLEKAQNIWKTEFEKSDELVKARNGA